MNRCKWCNLKNELYVDYHDNEWGKLNLDDKYLMKLIKGKIGLEICRCILDLLNQGYNLNNFINNNKEDFHIFLKLLLSVAQNHKEVQYILNIIKGLIPTLKFIKENIDILLIIESKCFQITMK